MKKYLNKFYIAQKPPIYAILMGFYSKTSLNLFNYEQKAHFYQYLPNFFCLRFAKHQK